MHTSESSESAVVTASLAPQGLAVDVSTEADFFLRADEPEENGGQNTGPDPFAYLFTALASCILITIRMYASRKSWPLDGATIQIFPVEHAGFVVKRIEYTLELVGKLSDEQRSRIRQVAHQCPVHKTLVGGVEIAERIEK